MERKQLKSILTHIVYFGIFMVLQLAETMEGLKPFALGFFVALVYSKQNILYLAPLYILTGYIVDPSFTMLATTAAPVFVLTIAYLIHYKIKKPVRLLSINIYTLISQIPFIALNISGGATVQNTIFAVVLTEIFAYAAIIVVYAVVVRGLRYRFTVDELVSGGVVIVAIAMGLFGVKIVGYEPYYMISAFVILFSIYAVAESGIVIAGVIGLGGALACGNIAIIGVLILWAVLAVIFKKISPYLMSLAVFIADVVAGMYFGAYSAITYEHYISLLIGLVAFAVLGNKNRAMLAGTFSAIKEKYGTRLLINRNKVDISERLQEVSKVFYEMGGLLRADIKGLPSEEACKTKLTNELIEHLCENCSNRIKCEGMLGGSPAIVLGEVVDAGFRNGKVTLLDLPPYITGSCLRVSLLIPTLNEILEKFAGVIRLSEGEDDSKLMVSEQMSGVGYILDTLSNDIRCSVSFDTSKERRLIDELSYVNIICSEAVVIVTGKDTNITLVVRPQDAERLALVKVVGKVFGMRMHMTKGKSPSAECAVVHLNPAPRYELVFGECSVKKIGSSGNGDTHSLMRLADYRYIMALCDGMGSGSVAARESGSAIAMIENFYKAGFTHEVILTLVNKLLTIRSIESFNALDMCVINPNNGACDILKLGAPEGFLKRKDKVEIIEGACLPVGILDEMKPKVTRRTLAENDILLLVSDGVMDTLGLAYIRDYLTESSAINPQLIANEIIKKAQDKGANDDITALACRVITRM